MTATRPIGISEKSAIIEGDIGWLSVPQDYLSGSPLKSNVSWEGATLDSLGLASDTYVWTWGSGETADRYTLIIGQAPPAPPPPPAEPAAVSTLGNLSALFSMAMLGVAGLLRLHRRG